jgi:hypothetical protein
LVLGIGDKEEQRKSVSVHQQSFAKWVMNKPAIGKVDHPLRKGLGGNSAKSLQIILR